MGLHFLKGFAPFIFYFFGIAIVFISLFKVEWGILFLIPILPLQTVLDRMHSFPFGKDFVDILLFAMIIGWIMRKMNSREKLLADSALNVTLAIFIFYTAFTLYHGSGYLRYLIGQDAYVPRVQNWKNYMILPVIYFLVANNIKEKKHIEWLTLLMIAVIFLMSLQFFRGYRWVDKSFFRDDMRWSGTFSYLGPNEYSAFFSHYIFVVAGLFFLVKSKLKKVFFAFTIIMSLYCIVFLFSRGSYFATLIVFALAGILRRKVWLLTLLVLLIISWHIIFPPAVTQRIQMTQNEYGELESSAAKRVDVWKTSMELFSNDPIVGIGFNTFPYLGLLLIDAHNIYVKTLLEQGIVGLFLLLLILSFALAYGWRLYRKAKDEFLKGLGFGFTMCTISLLISNFFGDRWTYVPLGAYFWAFLALVVRANLITNAEYYHPKTKK